MYVSHTFKQKNKILNSLSKQEENSKSKLKNKERKKQQQQQQKKGTEEQLEDFYIKGHMVEF